MIELDRRYDPVQNNELIGRLLNDATPLEQTTRETEAMFNDIKKELSSARIKMHTIAYVPTQSAVRAFCKRALPTNRVFQALVQSR